MTKFYVRVGTSTFALAAAAVFPQLAIAQSVDAQSSETGTIVVTGARPIAESEAAALERQRNSDSLVSVAAADSVGRLPDQNVAQAASRLPGVAVERDQGQARYVSLRGAPNYWTTLSIDGINIVSPEGRDARLDSVPSAIASAIVVSKAVTPEMPGETVAGNVNIITRSAFDYSGPHIAGKIGAGYAELGERGQYEASLVASERLAIGGGELGVLVSGSYFQRDMITDNFETDWERVSQDRKPGNETRFWGHETENKLYRLTRRNWSVSGRLDWKPDPDNTLSLRSIYTIFTDNEARDNYRFDLDDRQADLSNSTASCATAVNPSPTTAGYADVCIGNTPLQGTVYGIDIRPRATLRAFRQSIFTNTLAGDHRFGDTWQAEWLANYTRSIDDRSVVGEGSWESPGTRTLRPTVAYNFSNPNQHQVQLSRTLQLSSPTRYQAGERVTDINAFSFPLTSFTVLDAVDTTNAYTGKLVLARETPLLGADAVLRLGVQFDQRTKAADEKQIALNTPAQFAAIGIPTTLREITLDTPFQGEIPLGYTFRYFDQETIRTASQNAQRSFAFVPSTANNYEVREQVYAAFAMATLDYNWGSVLGGVRVEHLKNRGSAVATIGAVTGPLVAENEQTLVFPSLHLNFDIDDTKKFRLSFNSGAARADYDQLRPNVVVNDPNQTISGGNPGVKPERAYGVDAYFEWYLRPQGYLSVGVFYKQVEDVLYRQTRTFGSNALDSNGVDRSAYVFSGITNGGSGYVMGAEAAAQLQLEPWTQALGLPEVLGGFGLSANLTLNKSEVEKPAIGAVPARQLRLPGTSDVVFNVGPYYEKYGLSLRFQYQFRSTWLDGIADDLTDAGDTYWAADDELDFSVRYALTPNFEVFADATNLLNNPGRRYVEPGNLLTAIAIPTPSIDTYTIEWERFGRRFSGGIRFNF
jgi:TonB-dependent receptor